MNSAFNEYLSHAFDYIEDGRIKEAMLYSLLGGGKRVRPNILFAILRDFNEDVEKAYPIAAAIEMIHTYSLIHDDLPAMDNDDLRRGRATCHKKYDEATAILAGDALLTEAFHMVAKSQYDNDIKANIMMNLAREAGANGMIRGQELDIYQKEGDSLLDQDLLKTGCLLALPLVCGAIIADNYDFIEELEEMGKLFGLIFQIQDDLLETKSTEETFGKSVHSDQDNNKKTYVTEFGEEKCNEIIKEYYNKIEVINEESEHMFTNVLDYLKSLEHRSY